MDNTATQTTDNQSTQTDSQTSNDQTTTSSSATGTTVNAGTQAGWKSGLRTDLRDSPLLQKFDDTPDGLNKALESHANLEKLLGHEKVPIPKDVNDLEGWNRFSKAMGIPDKADGYGLPDAKLPDDMKGITLDKNQFAEVMHAHKVHPSAVKGIWDAYQKINIEAYKKAMQTHQSQLTQNVNKLKGEWGDAYNTNVELGQTVINKFSDDQEMNDYLTAVLSQDARGIKFLAKIGDNFAENKIGEFSMKKFTLSPDEAQDKIEKIKRDMDGPYMNQKGKFTEAEHQAAIAEVNGLIASIHRARQG